MSEARPDLLDQIDKWLGPFPTVGHSHEGHTDQDCSYRPHGPDSLRCGYSFKKHIIAEARADLAALRLEICTLNVHKLVECIVFDLFANGMVNRERVTHAALSEYFTWAVKEYAGPRSQAEQHAEAAEAQIARLTAELAGKRVE